jgi:hypothetical protein
LLDLSVKMLPVFQGVVGVLKLGNFGITRTLPHARFMWRDRTIRRTMVKPQRTNCLSR